MLFSSTMILFPILLLLTFTRSVFSNFTLTDHGHGIATGFCKLTATGSKQFSSTTPYFKMGEDGEPFDVSDAREKLGERFHGDIFPDPSNTTILIASLTIRGYTRADLDLNLFCFATLHDSYDTVVQSPLKLEEEDQEKSSPPSHTQYIQLVTVAVIAAVLFVVVVVESLIIVGILVYFVIRRKKKLKKISEMELTTVDNNSPLSSLTLTDVRPEVEDTLENTQELENRK